MTTPIMLMFIIMMVRMTTKMTVTFLRLLRVLGLRYP